MPRVAKAEVKEFFIVTGEWKWKAKPGEAPVSDRGHGSAHGIERYVFDPGFIVVNKGDTVVLRIHTVKGSKHQVVIMDGSPSWTIHITRLLLRTERSTSQISLPERTNSRLGTKNWAVSMSG